MAVHSLSQTLAGGREEETCREILSLGTSLQLELAFPEKFSLPGFPPTPNTRRMNSCVSLTLLQRPIFVLILFFFKKNLSYYFLCIGTLLACMSV